MKKTKWPSEMIEEFRAWHENRMVECEYTKEIIDELRSARERWLPQEE